MRTFKILFLLLFLNSVASFGQATQSTLTVMDVTGNYVYYEYNFNATGGLVSESGPGAPIGTPVKIKLSTSSGAIPTFVTGDLHGDCDTFQTGSMNASNTEFTTTLNSCCPSTTQIRLSSGLLFWITIKCAVYGGNGGPGGPGGPGSTGSACITYNLSSICDDVAYCISFFLPSNASSLCRNKNYTAVISFTDGTSTTIIVNFAANNTVFCFVKPINMLVSSNFSTCSCPISIERVNQDTSAIKTMDKIVVSPNPTTSVIRFNGADLENYKVSVYDLNGKQVINNSKINAELSLEKQAKGVYIYIITDANGYNQEGKIIKE